MPEKKRCCHLPSFCLLKRILSQYFPRSLLCNSLQEFLSVFFDHVNVYWPVAVGTFHIQMV